MNEELQQYPEIEIDKIIIPEQRAHAIFTPEQREELKASIQAHGFRVPIILRQLPDGNFELVDGQNRIEVAKELGYVKVPYILAPSDEKRAILLNFQANYVRGFQNPVDGAEQMANALKAGATEEDLAKWTGHTIQWVRRMLILNDLPDEFKDALRQGRIPTGVVFEASKLGDPDLIYSAIKTAIDLGWGVKEMTFFVANKLDEIKRKRFEEPTFTPSELGSIEEAKRLARLRTCDICALQYDVDDVWAGIVCQNCLAILKIIRQLEPDPQKALEFVEKVIVETKERKLLEELKKKYEGPTTPPESFKIASE
jgi:ParB/RepB/Spo0J family partition protein